jgi:vancomycin permeability regulator SanA
MKRKPAFSSASKTSSRKTNIIPLIVILIIDFLILLFIKYKLNGLSVTEYSFGNFGNLLNLFFVIVIGLGVFFSARLKKGTTGSKNKLILILLLFSVLTHLLILIHEYLRIGVPSFLSELATTKRIYFSYLFIFSQIIQFYILSLIAGAFFGETKLVYLKALFKTIFIAVFLLIFTFFYSVFKKHGDENLKKVEQKTGVVLGAAVLRRDKPSPIFEGRIKKAYELYSQKIIQKVQLTGSNAPGEKSEAKTALDYLKNLEINPKDLFLEEKSSNTVEQIAYLKKKYPVELNENKFVIISDEFHLVRALEICKFFDISAESSASEFNITWEKLLYYRLRESAALLIFWLFAI